MSHRDRCALTVLVALVAMMAQSREASAHPWGDNDVGVGIVFNQPTGLTAEFRVAPWSSLELALGLDTFRREGGGYFHLQYLVRPFALVHKPSIAVPVYLGIGGFIVDHHRRFRDDLHLGVRAPFGLSFEFRPPVQIFAELAIRLYLVDIDHDVAHDHGADLSGAIGFRVFF